MKRNALIWLTGLVITSIGVMPLHANNGNDKKNSAGELRFSQSTIVVAEDIGTFEVRVRRHRGSSGDISVDFETMDGSAVADEDYVAAAGSLSWDDGDDDTQSIEIEIIDDDEREKLERFRVVLGNVTGDATLARNLSHIDVHILPSDLGGGDDSEPPAGVLRFDQRTYETKEGSGTAVITVERKGGSEGAVTVDYLTKDRSATQPDDYEETTGTLSWADGEDGLQSFTVPITDDDVAERSEIVQLMLEGATGGAVIHPVRGLAALVIEDDDEGDRVGRAGEIGFAKERFQGIEGHGEARVVVVRRARQARACDGGLQDGCRHRRCRRRLSGRERHAVMGRW